MRRLIRFILDMDAQAWRTVLVSFLLFGGAGLLFLGAASLFGFQGEASALRWLGAAAHSPFALPIAVVTFAVLAFAAGSAIGFLPKILLTAMAGRSVAQAHGGQLWSNLGFLGVALAAWIGAGLLARRWIRRHEAEAGGAPAGEGT